MRWTSNGTFVVRRERLRTIGADGEVRDEAPVHDVEVDPVGAAGLARGDGLAEPGEVGREEGRGDPDRRVLTARLSGEATTKRDGVARRDGGARERELPEDRPRGRALVRLALHAADAEPARLERRLHALEVAADEVGHHPRGVRRAAVHEDVDGGVRARDRAGRTPCATTPVGPGSRADGDGGFLEALPDEREGRGARGDGPRGRASARCAAQRESQADGLPALDRRVGRRDLRADVTRGDLVVEGLLRRVHLDGEPELGRARGRLVRRQVHEARGRASTCPRRSARTRSTSRSRGHRPEQARTARVRTTPPMAADSSSQPRSLTRPAARADTPRSHAPPLLRRNPRPLPLARADLHLHTNASIFKYFRAANSRDSYNDPDETYRLAKARGMDFVTFTDHDTVDGCLKFRDRHPDYADFFVSAEIETFFPKTGHRIHVNVFDLTLAQWQVINSRARNIFDLVEYLRAENLLYSANHLFQSYRMRQAPEDFFTTMLELFDVFEVKNGSMAYQHNALVEDLLTAAKQKRGSLALVGGSDAHTYPPVASVFTMATGDDVEGVPRARSARAAASRGERRWASRASSATSTSCSGSTTAP